MKHNEKSPLIIFLAAPGAGKGTITQQAVEKLSITTVSTGNLLRQYRDGNDELGRELRACLDRGLLVSDDIVNRMVATWLQRHADGRPLILDGYPRTSAQAAYLSECVQELAAAYRLVVVELAIDDEIVVNRLASRMVCSNKECQKPFTVKLGDDAMIRCDQCDYVLCRRHDDEPEIIRDRLAVYHRQATELRNYYNEHGIACVTLSVANKNPQDVFDDFVRAVGV